jgi:hypothetical protein
VDAWIDAEADPDARAALLRHRERIINEMLKETEIANLKHRLAEAGGRVAGERLH